MLNAMLIESRLHLVNAVLDAPVEKLMTTHIARALGFTSRESRSASDLFLVLRIRTSLFRRRSRDKDKITADLAFFRHLVSNIDYIGRNWWSW